MSRLERLSIADRCGQVGLFTLVVFSLVYCTPESPPDTEQASEQQPSVHVAFSGGGWRAHTAASGWVMSLLSGGKKLEDVFANVGAISSNSGGSWFSTMLVYSNPFVDRIGAGIDNWGDPKASNPGWLGHQENLFDAAVAKFEPFDAGTPCSEYGSDLFILCVFQYYADERVPDQYNVVADLGFNGYPVPESLGDPRSGWAGTRPLLLAGTMLTTNAVLGEAETETKQYYQACITPLMPKLKTNSFGDDLGYPGASCGEATPEVAAVTFSSLPQGSTFATAPAFLPAVAEEGLFFNVLYSDNSDCELDCPDTAPTTIENLPAQSPPVSATAQVPVMAAAAASSAAGGFAASLEVAGYWQAAYEASDEALRFSLNGPVQHLQADDSDMAVEAWKNLKAVQIADGGPVDNSGVAQLVSFLQQNGKADNFNIVAFDNVQELWRPGTTSTGGMRGPDVGIDIAYLFGEGLAEGDEFCSAGLCVAVPDLQIFDRMSVSETWSAEPVGPGLVPQRLIYTRYRVITVNNAALNIKENSTGLLHVFTCAWADAPTLPTGEGDFDIYREMLGFIPEGLGREVNGSTGLEHLQTALGLRN